MERPFTAVLPVAGSEYNAHGFGYPEQLSVVSGVSKRVKQRVAVLV
jgi:hypothetical protein